jgi:hypothetical protein
MHKFRAYELDFVSELACPGFQPVDQEGFVADVVIRFGEVPPQLDTPNMSSACFQDSSQQFLLNVTDVARYLVVNGREIVIAPHPGAELDRVRLFLFGSAMGALLYQRSLFPLHGSAIETDLGAMVFVGPQGIGKSTLAAHFKYRGYRLLSDDVCAIARDAAGSLRVLPAFPQLRLCSDAFERLCAGAETDLTAHFDIDKFVISLEDSHCRESSGLCAVHLLSDHERPDIVQKTVLGYERINLLFNNLYRPSFACGFESRGDIMALASSIAKESAVTEIFRPRDSARIDELVDYLEEEWNTNEIYHRRGKGVCR